LVRFQGCVLDVRGAGAGSGASDAKRRSTFSVILDTLFV
jgi:hypothetical protein